MLTMKQGLLLLKKTELSCECVDWVFSRSLSDIRHLSARHSPSFPPAAPKPDLKPHPLPQEANGWPFIRRLLPVADRIA